MNFLSATAATQSNPHNIRMHITSRFLCVVLGFLGIGVWWTSGHPSEKGLILSANVLASEFSDWGAGKYTKANAWTSDSDCRKLLRYAEDRNY